MLRPDDIIAAPAEKVQPTPDVAAKKKEKKKLPLPKVNGQ